MTAGARPDGDAGWPTDPTDLADAVWLALLADDLPDRAGGAPWADVDPRDGDALDGEALADRAAPRRPAGPGAESRTPAGGRGDGPRPSRLPASTADEALERSGPAVGDDAAGGSGGTGWARRPAAGGPSRRGGRSWATPRPATLVALLEQPRGLRRALEPIRELVPSVGDTALDDEATAEHLADGRWRPEYRPVLERRYSLTLVVDDNWTMTIWAALLPRLVGALERLGVFRDVRVCYLDTDVSQAGALRLRGSLGRATGFSPAQLLESPGRRIIWVLTDGMGAAWREGLMGPVLWSWARSLPVALLSAVPRSTLRHTGIDVDQDQGDGGEPGSVAIPVLVAHPVSIGRWADHVAGQDVGEPGPVLPALRVGPGRERPGEAPDLDRNAEGLGRPEPPRTLAARLRSATSPAAFRLATRLAAAPVTRSTLRRLLATIEGPAGTSSAALAELFAHGVLHPAADGPTDDGSIAYHFAPGLREQILSYGTRAETLRVLRIVGAELGGRLEAVRHLSRALADPDGAPLPAVTADGVDYLAVEATALAALSGRYLARARRLQAALRRGPTSGHGTGRPYILGGVPPRNLGFVDRSGLLETLRNRLAEGGSARPPEALWGMGGGGKSQVAIEYVHRHGHEFDLVWWVPAEHSSQISSSLVELAQRLDLPVSTEANSAVPAVLEALRLGQPYAKWLLVLDNANDPGAARDYLVASDLGRVIVTSRNPDWAAVARPLEVGLFTRAQSVHLLRRRLPDLTMQDADRLAAVLGDLPLAVEHAAAWLVATDMAVESYLRLLRDQTAELLGRAEPPADVDVPVLAAWNVSLDRLPNAHPEALRLLRIGAYLAPTPIPLRILRGGRVAGPAGEPDAVPRDPTELDAAFHEITRYALAWIDQATDTIVVHALAQALVRARMTPAEDAAIHGEALALLAANDPGVPDDPATWPAYAQLYPHVIASDAVGSDAPEVRRLVVHEIVYLYRFGDHRSGLELAEHAHQTWAAASGEAAPSTLQAAGWLGWLYFTLGRYGDAARTNSRVLELSTAVNGPDHPETLLTMGNCITDRIVAGDFAAALEIAHERHRRAERAHGPDDGDTMLAAHDVAVGLRLVGRFADAQELDMVTWRRKAAIFGTGNLETLRTQLSLALNQEGLGDYRAALNHCEEIVRLLERTVDGQSDHFQLLQAQGRRAVALRKVGRHGEALATSGRVGAASARRYGKNHPRAIAATSSLAIDLRHAGEIDEALNLSAVALRRYERIFGGDQPYTLTASMQLAIATRRSGKPERALDLDTVAHTGLRRRLGDDHPWALAAATNLASDRYVLGRLALAYELDADTYQRSRRVLGDDHPSTMLAGANLAMDLGALGRPEESERLLARTVEGLERVLGPRHPLVTSVREGQRADVDIDPQPL